MSTEENIFGKNVRTFRLTSMDLDFFLNQRLSFVEFFYNQTIAAFEEIKRKIEAEESPYLDERDPESTDGPAFLEEWQNADSAMNITGAACLDILQSTLHAFLDQYMWEIGQTVLIPRLKEMKKGSWFGNYRAFFSEVLQISWEASGADLGLLEQVILARNDFTHNVDLLSNNSYQAKSHSEKYPTSAFTDNTGLLPFFRGKRLTVSADSLWQAKDAVRQLAEYLERERWEWLKRWRAMPREGSRIAHTNDT